MRCVVTGAAGFIGSNLVRYLQARGHSVITMDKEIDIVSEDLSLWFDGAEVVFHLAAISSLPECQADPARAFQVNVVGTARVLEACRTAKVRRVVFASTSAVYENTNMRDSGYVETDLVDPDLVYSQTKLAAERLCRGYVDNFGLDVVVLRLFNVYGPGQDIGRKSPPLTAYVARELLAGRIPVVFSDRAIGRDYVCVDDACNMMLRCAEYEDHGLVPRHRLFNVSSGLWHSATQLYDMVAGAVGSDVRPEFCAPGRFWQQYPSLETMSQERIAREVHKSSLGNSTRAWVDLGWRASMPIQTGIRKMVESMR